MTRAHKPRRLASPAPAKRPAAVCGACDSDLSHLISPTPRRARFDLCCEGMTLVSRGSATVH